MAMTELNRFGAPITACCNDGTYVWFVSGRGQLIRYTIAGGAVQYTARLSREVIAMETDGTSIWFVFPDGSIMKYTIATGAQTDVGIFPHGIKCITYYNSVVYVGLRNGKTYSIT